MTKNPFFKIVFILFSLAFIAFTIYNWTSKRSSYDDNFMDQIRYVREVAVKTQIPEQYFEYSSTPEKFLIDAFSIDSSLFFKKSFLMDTDFNSNRWETAKKVLNYREDKPIRELKIFMGDNYTETELTKDSKILKNDTVHLEGIVHFSKSGKLLLYSYLDSIVNFYDTKDQLRESISYKRHSSGETLNQHKSLEYDEFGNLTTYVEFHNNPQKEKYLFSYSTFEYGTQDNSIRIKRTIYGKEHNKDSYDKETIYYSFDEKQRLTHRTRIFSIASLGARGKNLVQRFLYQYNEKDQLKKIIQKEDYSVNNTEYTWERDDKNRLTSYKEEFYLGQTHYINKDCIVHHSPFERTEYRIETQNPKEDSMFKKGILRQHLIKKDAFGNTIFVKQVYEDDPENKEHWLYIDKKLKYLPNHTWYYEKQVMSYPYPSKELLKDMQETGFLKDDYSIVYREFNAANSVPDTQFTYIADANIEQMKRDFIARYLEQ